MNSGSLVHQPRNMGPMLRMLETRTCIKQDMIIYAACWGSQNVNLKCCVMKRKTGDNKPFKSIATHKVTEVKIQN